MSLFGDKLPDVNKIANDQASKVQGAGQNKLSEVKSAGESKFNDAKSLGEGKLNEAKGFGENKLNEAKGFGEGKFNEAKGFGEGKLNDAKSFGEGKLNDAKSFGEGKLNDAKSFGKGKLNDAKNFGEGKLNDAKSFGEGKLTEAKNFGQGKLDSVKGAGSPFSSKSDSGPFGSNTKSSAIPGGDSGKSGMAGGAASPMASGGKESSPMPGATAPQKTSPAGVGDKQATSAPGTSSSAGGGAAGSQSAPETKKYIVQANDDLGWIAKKFSLPSWKYLYEINKKDIGDNPDLLKAGTELTIPQWDSTSGDELIREKGADPFAYTGGLQYRYPWVPFSLSLKNEFNEPVVEYDENGKIRKEYSKPIKLCIIDKKRNVKIADVEAKEKFDEIELLIPDAQSITISSEEPNTMPGTLKELIKILEGIESEEGAEAACHFAYYLNYEKICDLVKKGGTDNDPNLMPTRFMLLPGMSDSTIITIDNHPDTPAGKPPFPMNVANLRKALNLLGFAVKEGSIFDESVLEPLLQYQRLLPARRKFTGVRTYTVQVGDTIGSIANNFGLPSWKYLYKINKETIGKDPNTLKTGIDIEIPQWDTTSGDEKLMNAGFDVFSFCNGVGFRYPWVLFSFKMNDDNGKPVTSFSKPTNVNITDKKSKKSLFKGTISALSELEMLIPDSGDINIGIQGMSFSLNDTVHEYIG